jgi:hypothetical protein
MPGDLIGLVAVTLLFGGGTLFLLSISPVGKAVAARILGRTTVSLDEEEVKHSLEAVRAELESLRELRAELTELAERVDFAERLLAQHRESGRLAPPQ